MKKKKKYSNIPKNLLNIISPIKYVAREVDESSSKEGKHTKKNTFQRSLVLPII